MSRHHSTLLCCYIAGYAAVLVLCLSISLMLACCLVHKLLSVMQKGDNAALLETKKKEMEVKRAAAASKVAKVFYKVTVKVRFQCVKRGGTEMPWNNCATFSLDVSPILSLGLDNVSGCYLGLPQQCHLLCCQMHRGQLETNIKLHSSVCISGQWNGHARQGHS